MNKSQKHRKRYFSGTPKKNR